MKVDMQSASRVTFNESAKNEADFKDSFNEVPQMNAAQRKKLRNNFSRRVNQIREKCSLVLDLDVDDMIDANHKLGWGLPEGFLEHAQISNFNPFKDQIKEKYGAYQQQRDILISELTLAPEDKDENAEAENENESPILHNIRTETSDKPPEVSQLKNLAEQAAEHLAPANNAGRQTKQSTTRSQQAFAQKGAKHAEVKAAYEDYKDGATGMLTVDNNNRLPSNPSQASLQDFMLSSETSRSIFKGKHRKASAASQNRSLKFKEEPDEIT